MRKGRGVDIGSAAGLVIVLVGVFLGMTMKGADPVAMFTNIPALLIVILGSIGAVVLGNPIAASLNALKALKKVFFPGPPPDLAETVERIAGLAERARREGLLALEDEVKTIDDPFLRRGLLLAVDGSDTETVRRVLVSDVKALKERHKVAAAWHTQVGVFSPTFGIIGAVVGLIAVMGKLEDPSELGHGIGAAFVATFWGVFMANALFLPWANKLRALSALEVAHRMLVIEGVIAVQLGSPPRAVVETLNTYLPPSDRRAA
jgi:chemotaxis protein MotA